MLSKTLNKMTMALVELQRDVGTTEMFEWLNGGSMNEVVRKPLTALLESNGFSQTKRYLKVSGTMKWWKPNDAGQSPFRTVDVDSWPDSEASLEGVAAGSQEGSLSCYVVNSPENQRSL